MKKFVAVIAFAMLSASCDDIDSLAGAPQRDVIIWGVGATSCGEYINAVEEHKINESLYGQWLHGYITGLNVSDLQFEDHAARIDRAGQMTWITDYCKQHLLDNFVVAAQRLVDELKTKKRLVPASDL